MPVILFRRALALCALAAVLAGMAGCRDQPSGAARVTVIGPTPALRDPAVSALSAGDALLLSAVAQGLVQIDPTGEIVGGLAERWNVSDDGQSYIFRLASSEWPDGTKVTARQVARALKRSLGPRSNNPLKDTFGAVEDIVAMTDRVIEIRLRAPRPNLLALLAQPEMAIMLAGRGTGPFRIVSSPEGEKGALHLVRTVQAFDGSDERRDSVVLSGQPSREAVASFAQGDTDLVLGGTFADLPFARAARLPRASLRFDPVSGLFGLAPMGTSKLAADPDKRRLLSEAIDRQALVAGLGIAGLAARATLLERGLDGIDAVVEPAFLSTPIADRRAALQAQAERLFANDDKPIVRVLLAEGPGGDRLLQRLAVDWGALGIGVERAKSARDADFRVIDTVAPSTSPAWFVRSFRCAVVALCDSEADELMNAARDVLVPAQRYALLTQAAARIDDAHLFIPLTAPVRWSLVAPRIRGFAGNRAARHSLMDLEQSPTPGGS